MYKYGSYEQMNISKKYFTYYKQWKYITWDVRRILVLKALMFKEIDYRLVTKRENIDLLKLIKNWILKQFRD